MKKEQPFNKSSEIRQFRVLTEQCSNLAVQVLEVLNQTDNRTDLIRDILFLVKVTTGLEAVGIRLREGDDFPYYETIGFSREFVKAEKYLCARDQTKEVIRDSQGNPYLECMCGNVLSGRTSSSLPFFTGGGSFWSNGTSALLASTTEEERQGRTRNRCNREGYESVALIPLRSGRNIIGLLQLNDRRENLFTEHLIRFFEGVGYSIGIALRLKQRETDTFREMNINSRDDDLITRPRKGGVAPDKDHKHLSEREHEVLRLIASGMNAREIGERLFISERTVTTHRSRIMDKLEIHKSVDLVRYAVYFGLIGEGLPE